jgi:N utilization substance protein B
VSIGSRRKARALALQVLYAQDMAAGQPVDEAVASYGDRFDLEVEPEAREFAQVLARAATRDPGAVDAAIGAASRNWRLERMARVDRNILRLAVGELLNVRETPVKVVINEAVELAKRFGTAESPAFVNGVLDRVAHGLDRPDAAELGPTPGGPAGAAGPDDPGATGGEGGDGGGGAAAG